jgi:hypothetical protein
MASFHSRMLKESWCIRHHYSSNYRCNVIINNRCHKYTVWPMDDNEGLVSWDITLSRQITLSRLQCSQNTCTSWVHCNPQLSFSFFPVLRLMFAFSFENSRHTNILLLRFHATFFQYSFGFQMPGKRSFSRPTLWAICGTKHPTDTDSLYTGGKVFNFYSNEVRWSEIAVNHFPRQVTVQRWSRVTIDGFLDTMGEVFDGL